MSTTVASVLAGRHDHDPEAVLAVRNDAPGTIDYANPAAARLFARPVDELVGLALEELVPERLRGGHERLRRAVLAQPIASWRRRHRVVHALIDGEEHLVVVDLSPADGQPEHVVATVQPLEVWLDATAWTLSAFEHSPTPIALVELTEHGDRIIRAANDALADLLGYGVADLLGMPFENLTFAEDEPGDRAAAAAMAEGSVDRYARRKRYRHRDGHSVWCDLSSRVLPSGGHPALALAHLTDVGAAVELAELHRDTETRLRAEVAARTQALAESEQQLRQSLVAASMASWSYDVALDRFTLVADDRTWPELRSGRTAADVLAMLHTDDVGPLTEAVRSATGAGRSFDLTLRTRPGLPRRWVRIAGDAVAGEAGRVRRVIGVVQDVTPIQVLLEASKAAERQLREREDRLRLVLAATTTGTWDWNVADGTIEFSLEFLRHLGYERTLSGDAPWSWDRIVHPDDMAALDQQLLDHFEQRTAFCECVHRLRSGDGSWRWFRTRGRAVERDDSGAPRRMIGAAMDISDQKRMEDQLVHGAKMQALGAFAGSVAHDFNNVMAIVRGHVELLRHPLGGVPADAEETDRRLAAIEQSVDRATSFVRQLMALGRPDTNRPADIDLAGFVSDLAPTLAQFLGEDIALEVDVPDGGLAVRIDAGRLEALLLNLAANARDAMASGGTMTIAVRADRTDEGGDLAVMDVSDNGVGMDVETITSAFEPFFTTKAPGLGTGLGLANALATVSAAGGTIAVASTVGAGTTVTISLPIAPTSTPAGDAARSPIAPDPLRNDPAGGGRARTAGTDRRRRACARPSGP